MLSSLLALIERLSLLTRAATCPAGLSLLGRAEVEEEGGDRRGLGDSIHSCA